MAGNEDPMKNLPAVGQDGEAKDSLTAAKRKADDSQVAAVAAAAAAAAGASPDEKAEATGGGDGKAPEIKWEEMSLEYIAWLLSQKREREDHRSGTATTDGNGYKPGELILDIMADDEAGKEEFFAFQDWVREIFDRNGCVMVPEGSNGRGSQDLIDEAWEKGRRELEMIDGCPPFINGEEEDYAAVALPSSK